MRQRRQQQVMHRVALPSVQLQAEPRWMCAAPMHCRCLQRQPVVPCAAAVAVAATTAGSSPAVGGVVRLKLTVAYDGSELAGFQWQAGKVRTVQGELERAAARVLLPASRVVGASRTDGGAHARGAVAHLDVTGAPESIEPESLALCLNGVLPPDIKVQAVELAPPGACSEPDAHSSAGCDAS